VIESDAVLNIGSVGSKGETGVGGVADFGLVFPMRKISRNVGVVDRVGFAGGLRVVPRSWADGFECAGGKK